MFLIVKELERPERATILEVLQGRLLESHPKCSEIKQDLIWVLTGFKGEKAVSYYLDFLPENDYYIFHSLRLPSGKHHFQVDFLLLSSRFALILECKNFFGTLFFDETFKQLIRTTDEKEEGFQDPISQAKWHQQQLGNWFRAHNYDAPVNYLVVISHPSTIVKTNPKNQQALKKVVHGHSLLEKIEEVSRLYQKEIFDTKGLRKISKQLLKSHTPEKFDAMKKYSLSKKEILTGVRCPGCGCIPMSRKNRAWVCCACGLKDKNAHISALYDYFYMVSPTITNKQFREFVHLESESTAKRMLSTLNLPYTGANKGRVYQKPVKI